MAAVVVGGSWEICCRDLGHGGKEGDPPKRTVEMVAVVVELGDPLIGW